MASGYDMLTFARGDDLSGTLQGAGGIGGLLARSAQATVVPWYVLPGGGPLYTVSSYYHADGNGNITMLLDASQNVVAKYLYDPFGNTLAQSGPLAEANTYRFSSKEWDANAGLYYYLYRFYDPSLQRWPNRDPLDEPGFETLHLIDQDLYTRKVRIPINDLEMQVQISKAIDNGNINVKDFLRNSQMKFNSRNINVGNYSDNSQTTHILAISVPAFFDVMRNAPNIFAPNWPVELFGPNSFEFDDNNSIDFVDPHGEQIGVIIITVILIAIVLHNGCEEAEPGHNNQPDEPPDDPTPTPGPIVPQPPVPSPP